MNDKKIGKPIRIVLAIDLLLLYICIVSFVNVFLLSFRLFFPVLSLVLSAIILIFGVFLFKIKISLKDSRFSLLFLLIIIVALFLRWNPNLYLTGGQDPGTYVSLSKQYEINNSLYIKDDVREFSSEDAKYYYDIGTTYAGVKEYDVENSEYYMPFYPVFPSWMAIFGSILGTSYRVYALTMFGVLSIVATYLFSYEISNKNKSVGLLASVLLAVNPLHVYFSKVPVTEIVSLTFMLFFLYFLTRFYNNYKNGNRGKQSLLFSLVCANVLFYTRMNAVFFLPIIILIPIISGMFSKDNKLTKYLKYYSIAWVVTLLLSFVFYKTFLPYLYNLVVGKRLLNYFSSTVSIVILVSSLLLIVISLSLKKTRKVVKKILIFFYNNLSKLSISIFVGLILYGSYFYVKEIFIDNGYTLFSFESLSYFKQLGFITTFLYLSPIGFVLLPFSYFYLTKKMDIKIGLLILSSLIFLIYCLGMLRMTQYHYYFARYQLSELIPLCTIIISIFLVNISQKELGKILLFITIIFSTIYFGYFSVLQLRDYEGSDPVSYEYLDELVGENDLLFIANNNFGSFNQIALPIKYYYDINVFPMYYLSYIEKEEFIELKSEYDNVYILTTVSNLARLDRDSFELIEEIEFKNNYFVHCLREEDEYFEMIGHSNDIPMCEYVIIPSRFYYGSFSTFLFRWE